MGRCLILLSAACGVGKSTVKNALNEMNLLPDFACIDSDEVRLNWWTYKGTPREQDYTKDCLARAFELAGDKHLLFGTCNDPISFFERVPLPEDVTATYVGMVCSDAEVRRRLLARPPERMCGEESFILSLIDYNGWIRDHARLYGLHFDNSDMTVEEAARRVADFAQQKADEVTTS